jgi:long-chain acyl-CoA synthetase
MINLAPGDAYISYLPFPHSFEQCLSFFSVMMGVKVGFYQGDPLKLTEELAQKAIATKIHSLRTGPFYTDGCYDKLVFRKVANLLGGDVKYMITASAPIDPTVLEFLKICFCCPMLEGYGLTETSGGSAFTWT